jgi:hypothetical protein
MKRNLIALAVTLGFAATAAVAEPTLELDTKDRAMRSAPEATSYQADTKAAGVRLTERDEFQPFNP